MMRERSSGPQNREPGTEVGLSAAVEGRAVSAGYASGDGKTRAVFRDVDFAVPEGGHLVVLGRSGSGKSTLLRLLNRFEDPTSGTLLFRGKSLGQYDPLALRRKVALVLQIPILLEGTVVDNLRLRPRHAPPPDDAVLAALLGDVGLGEDFLNRDATRLSVGEKQRVSLARALVSHPDVLLLDEPTSALDPKSRGVVAELILSLEARHRLTVLVATHQAELVRRIGGPVLLLEGGVGRTDVADGELSAFLDGV
jgi:putative ABC transport system ATP-binding protein